MKDVSASWMWVLSVVSAPSSETLQLFFLALLHLDTNSPTPWRKLYGVHQGRALSANASSLLDD